MSILRTLAIMLVATTAIPAKAGRAGGVIGSTCQTVKYDPTCNPQNKQLQLLKDQCELQRAQNMCDEFANSNPQAKEKLINCTEFNTCPLSTSIDAQIKACAGAIGEAWKDTAISLFNILSGKATAPTEDQLKQIEFFKTCKTPEQKQKMLGNFAFYFTKEEIEGHPERTDLKEDPANQNYLQGYSCATLYRELLKRMKKDFETKGIDDKFIQPWSGKEAKRPRSAKNLGSSVRELANSMLEKSGVTNTACYKPEVVREMNCYAIAMVVDPLLAAGGAIKLARVAGLIEKTEKSASAVAAAEKAMVEPIAADASNTIAIGTEKTKGSLLQTVAKTHVSLEAKGAEGKRVRMDPSTAGLTKTAEGAPIAPVRIEIGASPELRENLIRTMKKMNGRKAYSCVDGVCKALEANGFSIPGYSGKSQVFSSHKEIYEALKSGSVLYKGKPIPKDSIRLVASSEEELARFLAAKSDKVRFIVVPVAYTAGWAYIISEVKAFAESE